MKVDKTKWGKKTLGEICYIYDSQRKPVSKENRIKGIYPYYGATGLQDYVHDYIFDGRYLLLGEDGGKWNAKENSAYIVEGKIWVNNHAHILQFKNNIIDSYICYYLNYSDLMEYITGSIVPKLTQAKMRKIEIPIPPLTEQRAIATELDAVQKMIEGYKAQLADLDTLGQSIFLDMFGDPITNPKGWEKTKLSAEGTIIGGATPRTDNLSNWDNGIYYWITPAELNGNRYYGSTRKTITDVAVKNTHLTLLPIGTVLLSSRAPIGKVGITTQAMYCNQGFKNIICGPNLNNEYLYQYLLFNTEELNRRGNGVTFKEISKKIVEEFPLILPPLPLQQQFAERVEAIERQKELLQAQLAEAQTLMAERMQYYFD